MYHEILAPFRSYEYASKEAVTSEKESGKAGSAFIEAPLAPDGSCASAVGPFVRKNKPAILKINSVFSTYISIGYHAEMYVYSPVHA